MCRHSFFHKWKSQQFTGLQNNFYPTILIHFSRVFSTLGLGGGEESRDMEKLRSKNLFSPRGVQLLCYMRLKTFSSLETATAIANVVYKYWKLNSRKNWGLSHWKAPHWALGHSTKSANAMTFRQIFLLSYRRQCCSFSVLKNCVKYLWTSKNNSNLEFFPRPTFFHTAGSLTTKKKLSFLHTLKVESCVRSWMWGDFKDFFDIVNIFIHWYTLCSTIESQWNSRNVRKSRELNFRLGDYNMQLDQFTYLGETLNILLFCCHFTS